MKKITLLAALFAATLTFGQNLLVDRVADNTTGLISTKGDDGTGVYCSDYFTIDSEVALGSVTFPGLASNGATIVGDVTAFNIFIYADDGGSPAGNPELAGTGVAELAEIPVGAFVLTEDGAGNSDFTVEMTAANGGDQVVLQPGNYWISAFPSVTGAPGGNGRWNWFGSLTAAPAELPLLIDPADLFGAGATDWTPIEDLIAPDPFPSFGWTLTDEPILGVNENQLSDLSIYPNPSNGSNVTISSRLSGDMNVVVFDVLGKQVLNVSTTGDLNVSTLKAGVYMVQVTQEGVQATKKLVIR